MFSVFVICYILFSMFLVLHSAEDHRKSITSGDLNEEKLFYIYNWPDLIDRYPKYTDRDFKQHGVEFPAWTTNFGAGRQINAVNMEYKTSQFSLFKIMFERAMIDPRRTDDPLKATSFLIPYDIGMNGCFTLPHGRMRRTNCPLSWEVTRRLHESPYFKRNGGHDHTLIVSTNQNMNYFFLDTNCSTVFRACWNCTKLAIDEYLFTSQDREFELRQRGINWHAVPFPSDYHYSPLSSHGATPAWEMVDTNRKVVVSFTGGERRLSKISTKIREGLVALCKNHTDYCSTKQYKTGYNVGTTMHQMSRDSVFCLQPPGDMPTRKAVFDAVLSGCIVVLFHPLTAKFMYEWHLSEQEWDAISISYDTVEAQRGIMNLSLDVIEALHTIYVKEPERVKAMQASIRKLAFRLQYSLVELDANGLRTTRSRLGTTGDVGGEGYVSDAYDIAMTTVLDIHAGHSTHKRRSSYIECSTWGLVPDKVLNRRVRPQTSDWCRNLQTTKDPYRPPSLVSPLFEARQR